ncbi:hypothetical protein ACLOJK_013157 [Asimina triloba]
MRLINAYSVGRRRGLLTTRHIAADVVDLPPMCRREGEEGTGDRRAMLTLVLAIDGVDKGGRSMEGNTGGERRTLLTKMSSVRLTAAGGRRGWQTEVGIDGDGGWYNGWPGSPDPEACRRRRRSRWLREKSTARWC